MWLSGVSVHTDAGDRVAASYAAPRRVQYGDGNEYTSAELLHVYIGSVALFGPPAVVVELLGQAMNEARAAWDAGNPDGPDDGPAGPALAVVPEGGER
jgi:hypothetical protein